MQNTKYEYRQLTLKNDDCSIRINLISMTKDEEIVCRNFRSTEELNLAIHAEIPQKYKRDKERNAKKLPNIGRNCQRGFASLFCVQNLSKSCEYI